MLYQPTYFFNIKSKITFTVFKSIATKNAISYVVDDLFITAFISGYCTYVLTLRALRNVFANVTYLITDNIICLGDCTVGKTAITQSFSNDGTNFPKSYSMVCKTDFDSLSLLL